MAKKTVPTDIQDDMNEDATSELISEIENLTQSLQRERADAVNLRRRHEEEISGLRSIVKANVIKDLLPVIDNLDRSLKHVPKDLEDSDYVKGVKAVVKQFEKALESMGVEKIKTVDEPFDPSYHEAVAMEEGEGSKEVVSEELQSGYTVNGEVIRHAIVKVKML
jgi:molecular chaperone GrpE